MGKGSGIFGSPDHYVRSHIARMDALGIVYGIFVVLTILLLVGFVCYALVAIFRTDGVLGLWKDLGVLVGAATACTTLALIAVQINKARI